MWPNVADVCNSLKNRVLRPLQSLCSHLTIAMRLGRNLMTSITRGRSEHVMRKLMNAVVVAMVAGPALVLGQAGDVNKVLADMRAALGGAEKVAAVKTLTA